MKYNKIIVFDFETSGLSATNDQVIEIGAVVLVKNDEGKYEEETLLSRLLKVDKALPSKITEITGITAEMLEKDGIEQVTAFQELYNIYDENALLVAYNIQFDLGFLIEGFRKYVDHNFTITNDILDVMAVYKDRHFFPHRLESAIEKYGVTIPNSHRATDDCLATYDVLLKMKAEENDINKYVNVIGFNRKYGLSGIKLPHVTYMAQDGGRKQIKNR